MIYENINEIGLLVGGPVQIHEKVSFYIPTIKSIVEDKENKFTRYARIMTIMTREIFALQRNIEELTEKYPDTWYFLWEEDADKNFGALNGEKDKTFTMVVFEALAFFTQLELDGFKKLSTSQKIVHTGSEWIIDYDEFQRFRNFIKYIINYSEPETLAPKITSDRVFRTWSMIYRNRLKNQKLNKVTTWSEKILTLFASYGGSIPLADITEMSIFTFNQLLSLSSQKDAYDISMGVFLSSKFETPDGTGLPSHWKEKYTSGLSKYDGSLTKRKKEIEQELKSNQQKIQR